MIALSLCIPTYNRPDSTIKAFENVLEDPRIVEVVIVDDHSHPEMFAQLANNPVMSHPKIRLYRNNQNLGMSSNKRKCIELAKTNHCILFDSDNILEAKYLQALSELEEAYPAIYYSDEIILCPYKANPAFDYSGFMGQELRGVNVANYLRVGNKQIEALLNTCNYVVPRQAYLNAWVHNPDIKAADTIHFNYHWLSKVYHSLFIVPGMEYTHTIHEGSGFLQDVEYNLAKAREIQQKFLQLSDL